MMRRAQRRPLIVHQEKLLRSVVSDYIDRIVDGRGLRQRVITQPRPVADISHYRQNSFLKGIQEWEGAMNQKQHKHLSVTCQCGKVKFEAIGPPILTASCYCTSCQQAGRRFEQLASAPPVLDPDSGTGFVLYRKDRVQCATGQEYLEERRLK